MKEKKIVFRGWMLEKLDELSSGQKELKKLSGKHKCKGLPDFR
jgi:hypothetical protein